MWAEYRVHEGGYTQVVRRVTEPAAFAWAERARTMIQGIYRDLVLGSIEARCFTQRLLTARTTLQSSCSRCPTASMLDGDQLRRAANVTMSK